MSHALISLRMLVLNDFPARRVLSGSNAVAAAWREADYDGGAWTPARWGAHYGQAVHGGGGAAGDAGAGGGRLRKMCGCAATTKSVSRQRPSGGQPSGVGGGGSVGGGGGGSGGGGGGLAEQGWAAFLSAVREEEEREEDAETERRAAAVAAERHAYLATAHTYVNAAHPTAVGGPGPPAAIPIPMWPIGPPLTPSHESPAAAGHSPDTKSRRLSYLVG